MEAVDTKPALRNTFFTHTYYRTINDQVVVNVTNKHLIDHELARSVRGNIIASFNRARKTPSFFYVGVPLWRTAYTL